MHPRLGGDLERSPSARTQHAADLAHVSERELGVREMLEDDMRDAHVDAACRDRAETRSVAEQPLDVVELIVGLGELEHPRGDVEGKDQLCAERKDTGEASHPTADVEDDVARIDLCPQRGQQPVEIPLALAPEALEVGMAVIEAIVDEIKRVLISPVIPKTRHFLGHPAGA